MNVPLELSYRHVHRTQDLEELIRQKAGRLQRICSYLSSCRVAVERDHKKQGTGDVFRVRVDLTVPPGHELTVTKHSDEKDMHVDLAATVRRAFDAVERPLQELVEEQRGEAKAHPEQEVTGIVHSLFPAQGYGFIRTLDGRDVYFHRNSVVNEDFDNLTEGTGVHVESEMGEKGLQATTVRVIGGTA
ncbi:MAG: cold shock domain-containing protein [Spirochaetota bacterium]